MNYRRHLRILSVLAATSLIILMNMSSCTPERGAQGEEGVRVLMLTARNWGLNYFLMQDLFDQYGWQVVQTGVSDTITACPYADQLAGLHPVIPDIPISGITDLSAYDALIIPPGTGHAYPIPNPFQDLLDSPQAMELIRQAVTGGTPVYAMCAGARVLAKADVLQGRRMVGSPRFRAEYEEAGAVYLGDELNDNAPLIDGNLVTAARGQYYNEANCLALATVIEGRQPVGGNRITGGEHIGSRRGGFEADRLDWSMTYGGEGAEGGRAICRAGDGGFLITGYTYAPGFKNPDLLIMKVDADGSPVWTRTFGGAGTEYGNDCIAVEDGYLITGFTTSFGSGARDVYVVKVNEQGEEIWTRTYGGPSWDVGTSLCEAGDGYVICGYTHSTGAGEEDVYLFKIDQFGTELWSRTYGGARSEMGNSVVPAGDGGFFIAATTGTYGGRNTDFFLIKTDSGGRERWAKTYGPRSDRGYGFDWCNSMCVTQDGGLALVGYTDSSDIMDIHVIRVDGRGIDSWASSFGNNPFYDYGNRIIETPDGGFIIAGVTKRTVDSPAIYDNDIYLTTLDADGNPVGSMSLGGPGNDWASDALMLENGDVIVLGYTASEGAGSFDICLMKIGIR